MAEIYRTPDDRFQGLPGYDFAPHYLELEGGLEGLRMHYLDEGDGDPILLLHGEPTWSFLYRKMIPPLSQRFRVIAPDYVGFGRSDKPTERDWYTYERHVDSIVQLIESLDLMEITVVVQDWGGPIGLRCAIEHEKRFARLVILNTGVMRPGPNWPSEAFMQWRNYAERNPDLDVGFIVQASTVTELSDDVLGGYTAPWPTPESKAGVAAFPLIVPLSENDPGAREMIRTGDALTEWSKPVLVAFSDSDPIFPQKAGERMASRIPQARFVPIQGASHFLQEDKGEEIARVIIESASGD
ncbi:MAG: haloalkane dehalogenase [Actinomycetota bacterium]